ncbi:MAG: hypothetical protein R3C18_15700 [Planctomycetaceae bacterium]
MDQAFLTKESTLFSRQGGGILLEDWLKVRSSTPGLAVDESVEVIDPRTAHSTVLAIPHGASFGLNHGRKAMFRWVNGRVSFDFAGGSEFQDLLRSILSELECNVFDEEGEEIVLG